MSFFISSFFCLPFLVNPHFSTIRNETIFFGLVTVLIASAFLAGFFGISRAYGRSNTRISKEMQHSICLQTLLIR